MIELQLLKLRDVSSLLVVFGVEEITIFTISKYTEGIGLQTLSSGYRTKQICDL